MNFVVLSGRLNYPHRGQRTRGKWISLTFRDGANPRALIPKTSWYDELGGGTRWSPPWWPLSGASLTRGSRGLAFKRAWSIWYSLWRLMRDSLVDLRRWIVCFWVLIKGSSTVVVQEKTFWTKRRGGKWSDGCTVERRTLIFS